MNKRWKSFYILPLLFLPACEPGEPEATSQQAPQEWEDTTPGNLADLDTQTRRELPPAVILADTGELERKMIGAGLVNVQSLDPSIQVELKYATSDNFLGRNVYGDLHRCYLQPEVAAMLAQASQNLQKENPQLRLHVFDGARPRSVQYQMWDIVKGTPQQDYVASPRSGSMHNYGASVDLTVATEAGELLDMGTPYDFFGDLAQPRMEQDFLRSGQLTRQQIDNRMILRKAMWSGGFQGILNEWWHFNAFSREEIKARYQPVE